MKVGEEHALTIRSLHDAYFATQGPLAETPANGFLREAGDQYASSVELDFDVAFALYQQSLEEHHNRNS